MIYGIPEIMKVIIIQQCASGFARCLISDFSTEVRPVHPEGIFPLFARNGGRELSED